MSAQPMADVWHESHKPAVLPALPPVTETGRRALAALLAQARTDDRAAARRSPAAPSAAWRDVPQLYRRMIVAAAGVAPEVVEKIDRDLTEREKVMIRSAVADMRAWFSTLVTL